MSQLFFRFIFHCWGIPMCFSINSLRCWYPVYIFGSLSYCLFGSTETHIHTFLLGTTYWYFCHTLYPGTAHTLLMLSTLALLILFSYSLPWHCSYSSRTLYPGTAHTLLILSTLALLILFSYSLPWHCSYSSHTLYSGIAHTLLILSTLALLILFSYSLPWHCSYSSHTLWATHTCKYSI